MCTIPSWSNLHHLRSWSQDWKPNNSSLRDINRIHSVTTMYMYYQKLTVTLNEYELLFYYSIKGGLGPYNEFNHVTFNWSACTNPGKWAVIYLCDRGIDFASFTIFGIGFRNCSDSVVFFVFLFFYYSITGFNVSNKTLETLVIRFTTHGRVLLDEFICILIKLSIAHGT